MSPEDNRPDMTRMPEWQRERRQRIITTGYVLLLDRPLEQIQMRDVANAAGVALGTLYRYFPSKDLLYAWVVSYWEAPLREATPPSDGDALSRLKAKVRRLVLACERDPHFLAAQQILRASTDPDVHVVMTEFERVGYAWLTDEVRAVLPEPRATELSDLLWALLSSLLPDVAARRRTPERTFLLLDSFLGLLAGEVVAPGPR